MATFLFLKKIGKGPTSKKKIECSRVGNCSRRNPLNLLNLHLQNSITSGTIVASHRKFGCLA
jgi:hypothetical protein